MMIRYFLVVHVLVSNAISNAGLAAAAGAGAGAGAGAADHHHHRETMTVLSPLSVEIDFDQPRGLTGFYYVTDMFVDGDEGYTNGYYSSFKGRPNDEDTETTAGLVVRLGGVNDTEAFDMSAGFRLDFITSEDLNVEVQFDYQVFWPYKYDGVDETNVLLGIDSKSVYEVDHFDFTTRPKGVNTEWRTATVDVGIINDGTHYVDIGGTNNHKDHEFERTIIYIDNVRISGTTIKAVTRPTPPPTPKPDSGSLTDIFLYNTETKEDVISLLDGPVIDISKMGTSFTIRVAGTGLDYKSVDFDLDGISSTNNDEPYTMFETISDKVPILSLNGEHTISAIARKTRKGNGPSRGQLIASFTIVGSTADPCKIDEPDSIPEPAPTDVRAYIASTKGWVTGQHRVWHKITIGFRGPLTCERDDPNPFTYYRLDVTFVHPSTGTTYIVPGYYAADGNAANTGATSGNVWLAHFAPDRTGTWEWSTSFTKGTNVAQDGGGISAGHFDGAIGSFDIQESNKEGRDHRHKGRLDYVGEHHLRFAGTGEWFLKAGVDSPENFLAYDDFDATTDYNTNRKSWKDHAQDYNTDDPTWAGGRGKNIMGTVNYLSEQGLNVFSFIVFNSGGDDKNVYPHVSSAYRDHRRMDVSKTAQWEVLFEHADRMGMFMHFKLQEIENAFRLDSGNLGPARKLYYRELIARFGHHLALNWNIGEENPNTPKQRLDFAEYIKMVDPYQHPVVIHSHKFNKQDVYPDLLGSPFYDGASQNNWEYELMDHTLEWLRRSAAAGRKWVVTCDEHGPIQEGLLPDADDPDHDVIRKNILWANIMAGGGGVEYYFGGAADFRTEDHRMRANMWAQSRHALNFFKINGIPFWDMFNANHLVSNGGYCLRERKDHSIFAVFLPNGGSAMMDLSSTSLARYTVQWYNPRGGGKLQAGSVQRVFSGSNDVSLGVAPHSTAKDWAVLLTPETKITFLNPSTGGQAIVDGGVDLCQFDGTTIESGIPLLVVPPETTDEVRFELSIAGGVVYTSRRKRFIDSRGIVTKYSMAGWSMGAPVSVPELLDVGFHSLTITLVSGGESIPPLIIPFSVSDCELV